MKIFVRNYNNKKRWGHNGPILLTWEKWDGAHFFTLLKRKGNAALRGDLT